MKELLANFKTTFNENGWFQTDAQKQVLASVKHILTKEKNPQIQCQALLKILYQYQQKHAASDDSHVQKLIFEVLTTWLLQEKPDRIQVQAVIGDLLDNSVVKEGKIDLKLLQFLKNLIVIGAQIAYYREDEHGGKKAWVENSQANTRDRQKDSLERSTSQLQYFLNDISSKVAKKQGMPFVTRDIFASLEKALNEIKISKSSEALDCFSAQNLFESFFPSNTYQAEEFERYQVFIKDWLANNVRKDQADEVLLLHLLSRGAEQVSKERESAGFGRGYKPFSAPAQQFIAFLTQIHQQYGIPNLIKFQKLKEDIAIGQAKLLDSISKEGEVFSFAEKLLAIANGCDVPPERHVAFYHRLWEVGVEKSSFVNAGLTNEYFSSYCFWRIPGYWYKGELLYQKEKFDEEGIPKIFWNGFLLKFIQSYRDKELNPLITEKNYLRLWTFCKEFTRLTYVSHTILYSRSNIEFLNSVREEIFQTMKDCQENFYSVDDVTRYLQAEITVKNGLLSNQCYWDCVGSDEKDHHKFVWERANDKRSKRLSVLTLGKQQLSRVLKIPSDYKKLLKVLVVDLLAVEEPLYTDFAVKQAKVLMDMSAEVTRAALYALKAEYLKPLEQNWGMLEARVLAPKHSLLSTVLDITCLNDMDYRYTDRHQYSANPLDEEHYYNQFFTRLFDALGDATPWLAALKFDRISSQTIQDALTDALIKLLQISYDALAVSNKNKFSLEKKWVSSLLMVFMLLKKPSSEQYQKLILTFYALRQKHQFTYELEKRDWSARNNYDYDFIIDLFIIRAQSLQTLEELKEFSDLLTELQQQYSFPKECVEQELEKAVASEIALLENPTLSPSTSDKRIDDFKIQRLVPYFASVQSCQGLLKAIFVLRNAYPLSLDQIDKALVKKLLYAAIEKDIHEPEWKNVDLKRVFALCRFFEGKQDIIDLIFSLLEKTKLVDQLNDLPKGTFEQQFIHYVIDKKAKKIGDRKFLIFPEGVEWIIKDTYHTLDNHDMAECMPSEFLQAYFSACFKKPDHIFDSTFLHLCLFAQFALYEMPYEDKAAPDLLKQLTAKLTVPQYEELIKKLIEYAAHKRKPTDKLENFLFTTLEIKANNATSQTEHTRLLEFLEKQLLFSSPDKQLAFMELVKKITTNQYQENLLAIERMSKELEALEVPAPILETVERFEGYESEKHKNNKIYLDYKKKLVIYQEALDEVKANCHQKVQLLKDNYQAYEEIDPSKFYKLVEDSKKAKTEIEEKLNNLVGSHENLTQEIKEKSLIVEALMTMRFNEAQAELAAQQQTLLTALDQKIDQRTKHIEVLHSDIGKLSDEETQFRAAVQDTGENDAWFMQAIALYRDVLPISLPSEENSIQAILGDLTLRQTGLQHILQNTDEARVAIEKQAALELKALQRFTEMLLPRLQDYRTRLQKVAENNRIAWTLANAVLTVLDHGILSALPFIVSLRAFSQGQQALASYRQPLVDLEAQCEALMTLQHPLSVDAHLNMTTIHHQLQHHLTQLQIQISNPFFAHLTGPLIEDDVEQAKSASMDTETKILKSEQANHWLLSEADALTTSTNGLLERLSPLQAHSAQYDTAGNILLKGIEEQTRLNALNTAIKAVRASKTQTEETVETVQTALATLFTAKQQFIEQIAEECYQAKVKAYRALAEEKLSPLEILLADRELSSQQKENVFNALVKNYPHCVNQRDENQQTPLHLAALRGDIAFVEMLLKAGANAHVKDTEEKTPLELALVAQQTAIVRCLKHYGVKSDGMVANVLLQQRIQNNDVAYVQFLLEEKSWLTLTINQRDAQGKNLLQQAVLLGHLEVVQLLLDRKANPNLKDDRGNTALHDAVNQKHLGLVKLLLEHGARTDIENDQGNKALNQESKNALLHLAAQLGDVETVQRFAVSTGVLLDTRHTDTQNAAKETPLHLAVKGRHGEVVHVLLQKGANPDVQNEQGETALSLAVHQGHINLVKALFLKGARLDSHNLAGETPFNTPRGRVVFKQLVPSTTKLNLADKERLVKQGGGAALLYLAMEEGHTELVQWLVEGQGIDLNTMDGEGTTLLGLLSRPQFFAVLSQDCDLKEAERLLGIKSSREDLAVQSLTTKSKRQVYLEYLIEKGAKFWQPQDRAGNHLLHLLVAQGLDDERVKSLVNRLIFFRRNSVLNTLNSQGETLLHDVLKQGNIELVALLVEKGARLDIVNREGEKPFDTTAGMAMYLTLKGQVIDDQTLSWLTRLRKWMEGRDYSGLLNKIEAEQQARKVSFENEPPSFFDEEEHKNVETLLQGKRAETNPFSAQEKLLPEAENKTSWFDQVGREMKETSLFFDSSVPIYPSVFKRPAISQSYKTPVQARQRSEQVAGDIFDHALQHGDYESAKQLLKENRGYQTNVSFQTLPRVIKRYLLLDSPALPKESALGRTKPHLQKEHTLAHAKKSLRLEEVYVEKHDALYDAVVNSDSRFVVEWFNAQETQIKHIEDLVKRGNKGAEAALALFNSQLFEVVNLQRNGITLFELLVEREKTRQLRALSWDESEAAQAAIKRREDGKILRVLMAYMPTSTLLPNSAEGVALYDLVEAPLEAARTQDNEHAIETDDFETPWLDSESAAVTLPIGAEEAPIQTSKRFPGWLGNAQKLFFEVTGFISESMDETKGKLSKTKQQITEHVIQTVVGPKDLIEVYAHNRPVLQGTSLAEKSYDLYVLASEKPPIREELDKLFYEGKEKDQQKVPMLVRYQHQLWFYGLTPGGMTLLESLDYQKHAELYDGILPEQGYDGVLMPKPLSAMATGEPQPFDAFDEQALGENEFRLRWDKERAALCYRVKDTQGRERSGFISTKERDELWGYLGGDRQDSRYFECLDALKEASRNPQAAAQLLTPYFLALLQITHKRKHTSLVKLLSKAQMPTELYEEIGKIKGHVHGMLPADERLKQGKALAEKMSTWIEEEMGKNFKGADIVDVRDGAGNTLLHLAVRDNLDVVVEWLLPSSLAQDLNTWFKRTLAEAKGKMLTIGASEAGGVIGNVAAAAVGTIVTGATLPVLGPLAIAAGVLAGKLTSMFAEGASELVVEKIYGVAKDKILLSLEQRIDVRHQNHAGDTVLHVAARTAVEHNLWIFAALLTKAKPDDLNIPNQVGNTPLHLAVNYRNAHIVALLLLAGANHNLPNTEGKTPLHLAAILGDETLFQMLIESGANVYAQTKLGQTAEQLLMKKVGLLDQQIVKQSNHPEKLTPLADEKARFERMLGILHNDKSLLQKAQHLKDENIIQQTEQQKETWWNKAEKASRQRAEKVVEPDERGNTLLHVLVQNKANYELVEDLLLHHDVKDLNRANHEGNTPLHLAVLHSGGKGTNAKMIRLLLAQDANRYASNHDGKTPIELVPDPHYQYKIDELLHPSHAQKKDSAETEFFNKTQTSNTSAQKPLDRTNNAKITRVC